MAVFGEQLHDPALINQAFRLRLEEHMPIRAISEITGIPRSTLGEYLKGQGESFHEIPCKHCGREMFALVSQKTFCCGKCKYHWYTANVPGWMARRRAYRRAYVARQRAKQA